MPASSCPKCPGTSFELVEARIRDSEFIHFFVQCSSCGCVVGVMEAACVNDQLRQIAERLGVRLK